MAGEAELERQALGILADTVTQELGRSNLVSREVQRAFVSGKPVDLFTARAAFNALPGWQRRQIGTAAEHHAVTSVRLGRSTGRDWRNLAKAEPKVVYPRFLRRPGTGAGE